MLSCTALLERAVLAAKDLKEAPKMLLTPKAISSYSQVGEKTHSPDQTCTAAFTSCKSSCTIPYLVSIDGVIVFYRIDFCHGEGHGEAHDGHGKRLHSCLLEDLQVWGDWGLVPENEYWCVMLKYLTVETSIQILPEIELYILVMGHHILNKDKCVLRVMDYTTL